MPQWKPHLQCMVQEFPHKQPHLKCCFHLNVFKKKREETRLNSDCCFVYKKIVLHGMNQHVSHIITLNVTMETLTYGCCQTHGEQQDDTPQHVPVEALLQTALFVPRPTVVLHGFGLMAWSVQHPIINKKDNNKHFYCVPTRDGN